MIAVVLVHELEQVIKDYRHALVERQMKVTFMEGITHTAIAASMAWLIFDIMKTETFLAENEVLVVQNVVQFQHVLNGISIIIGIVGGAIGAIGFTANLWAK